MNPLRNTCVVVFMALLLSEYGHTQTRTAAFTFDDLPLTGRAESLETAKYVNENILAVLKRREIPATGFVNEQKLFFEDEIDERTALLERWLDDGRDPSNHTFSHVFINSASFEDYKEDLIRGETVTRMLLKNRGRSLRYFRHTQLRTGPTDEYRSQLDALLASRKYITAPVTIDSNEYLFASKYKEAKQLSNTAHTDKLVSAYLLYME